MTSEEYIIGLISCLVFFAFIGGWKMLAYLKETKFRNNLFKKVGWIAEKEIYSIYYEDFVKLRSKELISYIIEEQHNMKININYCIDFNNETEKTYAEEILDSFKKDVTKSYFCGFLTTSKNICNLNSLEYYMYSLEAFFKRNSELYKPFFSDKIYKFQKEDGSDSYYTLTDFGRTYYKLYLISLMFIENNPKTRILFEYIDPKFKNRLMGYLESNEICFWTYRP